MSELIDNSFKRKGLLKHMILQLHKGEAPDEVKRQLIRLMKTVPYGDVVEVEQELISEGLPEDEVLRLCDIHTQALEGIISLEGSKPAPAGHPVHTFLMENKELLKITEQLDFIYDEITKIQSDSEIPNYLLKFKGLFNSLSDVDKHYKRKENLLFPFLEKNGITGPPKVMWGKHDEIREALRSAIEVLNVTDNITAEEASAVVEMILKPASNSIADMTMKEEQILFPMCMDKLTDIEWYDIYRQTDEYGFCLYDPQEPWKPEGIDTDEKLHEDGDTIHLPTGSFTKNELMAILNKLPVDITFVDRDDKVKYFSQNEDRIFSRSRAILKRDVRMCHPPSSVHVVENIVNDFKTGKQNRAPFWINLHGKFLHIEYFALRDEKGEYLGTLEVSQDLTNLRALEGEQRILSYSEKENHE
ncbi:MAG: uncharacterized protein QG635_833 [Bacteroidota bacterium]|nr:uncharacterized protein [Bacteroidota bacterium]